MISFIPMIIMIVLTVPPVWMIWKKSGHHGAWSLFMIFPGVGWISLWVLAFKEWPSNKNDQSGVFE